MPLLALAALARNSTSGGGCCSLILIALFVYIYRSGGTDWLRSIGAAVFPGLFGWFIWRDRELGAGARWTAVIMASLHAFFFLVGVVAALVLPGMVSRLAATTQTVVEKPIDLTNIPEDPALGLHPLATITSDPAGATVTVNGETRGKTPLETPLSAGQPNEVKVSLSGYFPATRSGAPNARERLQLSFTLQTAARLEVTSSPPGARVLMSRKEVLAKTPGIAEPLELGPGELLVLLDGHQAQRQAVELTAEKLTLHVDLEPGVKIAVTSVPDQADVFVDGQWQGVTPAAVFVSPQKKHTLEVKKEAWASAKKLFGPLKKPGEFHATLIDTERVQAQRSVTKAQARYDKLNQALEKLQTKLDGMQFVPTKLENQRVAMEREMQHAAEALEQAEGALRAVDEARPAPVRAPDDED